MLLEKYLSYQLVFLFGSTLFVVFSIYACSEKIMAPEKAQRVLNDFYTDNVPEDISDRHLVSAGKGIVPYLLIEIQKKDMPKRRYAIGALEKIKDKRAIPVLVQILNDNSEIGYFREDALRAIWHIDKKLGEEYADKFFGQYPEMNRVIELLREGRI